MLSLNHPVCRIASVVAVFGLLNLLVPYGALAIVVPPRSARHKQAPPPAAPQIESRPLSAKEMRSLQGRKNPYVAGQNKWDVVYQGINLMTGNFTTAATDLTFEGGYGVPVNVTRSYSSNGPDEGPLGYGWTLSVDIRSTAGGLLKSSGAPVRSVPVSFRMRPTLEEDPNAVAAPVEAVVSTDAGGKETTVQKDADGMLTTPAWDKNEVESEFEYVRHNGDLYHVLVRNVLRTPEGSIYEYRKLGTYPNGMRPWNSPAGTPSEPGHVLKISSVTDRHGNRTEYLYDEDENNFVAFQKSNGLAREARLLAIRMPNGHRISFGWQGNRIVTATDHPEGTPFHTGYRTVRYQYFEGQLSAVTTPGGLTTSYEYNTGALSTGQDPLTAIVDPRGLRTVIHYYMGKTRLHPYGYIPPSPWPMAYRIEHPNGVNTYVRVDTSQNPGDPFSMEQTDPVQFGEFVGNTMINYGTVGVYLAPGGSPVMRVVMSRNIFAMSPHQMNDPVNGGTWQKDYHPTRQDLLREIQVVYPRQRIGNDYVDIWNALHLPEASVAPQRIETNTSYNFMGNPLERRVKEGSQFDGLGNLIAVREAAIGYAYWGQEKYYQQKAVRDQAGRISFTDYYDDEAAQGWKGQTKRVYDAKHGSIDLNGPGPVPPGTPTSAAWRYVVRVANDQSYSAEFVYDEKGRPKQVRKLQRVNGAQRTYSVTSTEYGPDLPGHWGAPSFVVEDFGGPHSRTTQTLLYDSIGRAVKVRDAKGQIFQTEYDLDGKVLSVDRLDVNPPKRIVSYVYGSEGIATGMVLQVADGISGVEQNISYYPPGSGGATGQVWSVHERSSNDEYSTIYTYHPTGDRATATYQTPNGVTRWGYDLYIPVGAADAGQRVFQRLTKWVQSANGWVPSAEQFHYAYDSAGRIAYAAFAQTPQGPDGYTAQFPAKSRALAKYSYDAGGRLMSLEHLWQIRDHENESWASTEPILRSTYAYEVGVGLNRGLRTQAQFSKRNAAGTGWQVERTESYGYDPHLDYLTTANYGDGLAHQNQSWVYDAAGNRISDSTVSGNWSYNNLNMMTASPGFVYEHDVLGNRTWRNRTSPSGGQRYVWDALNRLDSFCTTTGGARYEYRADGMRTLKIEGLNLQWVPTDRTRSSGYYDAVWQENKPTTRYRYDGQMPIEEDFTRLVDNQIRVDVTKNGLGARGIDYLEKTTHQGTGKFFPIYDGHGNMIATLARGDGTTYQVADRRAYDAWGRIRQGAHTGDPKGRYVANLGHVQDDESGLVYMRARYYEPSTGRFISEDPAGDGSNWYIYARNIPTRFIDGGGTVAESDPFYYIMVNIGKALGALGMPFLKITGKITATYVFAYAAELNAIAIGMIGAGKAEFNLGYGILRSTSFAGGWSQAFLGGSWGAFHCIRGAKSVAIGVALLAISYVMLGLALIAEAEGRW